MLKKIIFLLIMFFSLGINAEQKYIGFNDPESVAEGPDGAIYVSEIGERGVEDGRISKISKDGSISTVAEGLNDPKGIVFFQNKLYVTDRDVILEVQLDGTWNVHTGTMAFPKTPVFLNDIEVAKNGDLYVSDSGDFKDSGFVFLIKKNSGVTVMFEDSKQIKAPNGLLAISDSKLLILDWAGELLEANLKNNQIVKIADGIEGGDGIAKKNDAIFVSSWKKGIVYKIKNGKTYVIKDGFQAAADIALSSDKKSLIIPDMKGGTVSVIKVN
jgi:sugar lactone lactonase YvrE